MTTDPAKSLRNVTERNRQARAGEAAEAIASLALAEARQVKGFDSMSDANQDSLVEQGKLNFTKMMRENPHEFSSHIQNFLESGEKLHGDFGRTETKRGKVLAGAGGKVASQLRSIAPTVKEMGLLKQSSSSGKGTSSASTSSPLDFIFQSKKSQEKKAEDQPYGFTEEKFKEDENFRDKILMHVDDLKKEIERGNKISEEDKKLLEKIEKQQKEKKEGKKDPRDFMTPDSAMLYTLGKGVFDLGKALPGLIGKAIDSFKTKGGVKDEPIAPKDKVEPDTAAEPTKVVDSTIPKGSLVGLDRSKVEALERESGIGLATAANDESIEQIPRIQPRDPKTGRFVKETEGPSYVMPAQHENIAKGLGGEGIFNINPEGILPQEIGAPVAPEDDVAQVDTKEMVEADQTHRQELLELEKKEVELLEKIASNTEGGGGAEGSGVDIGLPSIGGIASKAGGLLKSGAGMVMRGLASPVGLVAGAGVAGYAAGTALYNNSETVREGAGSVMENIFGKTETIEELETKRKENPEYKTQMKAALERREARLEKVQKGQSNVTVPITSPNNGLQEGSTASVIPSQSTQTGTGATVVNAPSNNTNVSQGASYERSHYPRNLDNSFVKWRDSRNAYI